MAEPLKNLYNRDFIKGLAVAVKHNEPEFACKKFEKAVFDKQWQARELKERMRHITLCLHAGLNRTYTDAIKILIPVSKKFSGFEQMFFPDFVEVYGMNHWVLSMKALEEFTKGSSSEFAVRPFIIKDEKRMMKQMKKWSQSKNHHVRRLASEGCRPRLPWSFALTGFKKNPKPILPILENLKDDESEYVRRSVANNLNDISKDHPPLVIKIAKKWHGKNENRNRLVKHALRTLLKKGDAEALAIIGFEKSRGAKVVNFKLVSKKISLNEKLKFSFKILPVGKGLVKIRLEYAIYYLKANGSLNKKIFQIGEKALDSKGVAVERSHLFKEMTTRKLYGGKHKLSIIANGNELAERDFTIKNNHDLCEV